MIAGWLFLAVLIAGNVMLLTGLCLLFRRFNRKPPVQSARSHQMLNKLTSLGLALDCVEDAWQPDNRPRPLPPEIWRLMRRELDSLAELARQEAVSPPVER